MKWFLCSGMSQEELAELEAGWRAVEECKQWIDRLPTSILSVVL